MFPHTSGSKISQRHQFHQLEPRGVRSFDVKGKQIKGEKKAIKLLETFEYKPGKEGVGVYSLVEQKNITFSNNIFENDLDSYLKKIDLSQALLNGYCDGEFLYFPVQAYMFFEEGNKPFSSNITNDSNPIIVKVKLK